MSGACPPIVPVPAGVVIGIDVSKARLDGAVLEPDAGTASRRPEPSQTFQAATTARGLDQLVTRLVALAPTLVVLEASGGYEQPVVQALWAAEIPVAVVNPARVRAFARGAGYGAKTDRLAAAVLAHFGLVLRPTPQTPPTLAQLRRLVRRREQVVGMLARERQRARQWAREDATIAERCQALIALLVAEVAALAAAIEALLGADPALAERIRHLQLTANTSGWLEPQRRIRPLSGRSCRELRETVLASTRADSGARRLPMAIPLWWATQVALPKQAAGEIEHDSAPLCRPQLDDVAVDGNDRQRPIPARRFVRLQVVVWDEDPQIIPHEHHDRDDSVVGQRAILIPSRSGTDLQVRRTIANWRLPNVADVIATDRRGALMHREDAGLRQGRRRAIRCRGHGRGRFGRLRGVSNRGRLSQDLVRGSGRFICGIAGQLGVDRRCHNVGHRWFIATATGDSDDHEQGDKRQTPARNRGQCCTTS